MVGSAGMPLSSKGQAPLEFICVSKVATRPKGVPAVVRSRTQMKRVCWSWRQLKKDNLDRPTVVGAFTSCGHGTGTSERPGVLTKPDGAAAPRGKFREILLLVGPTLCPLMK